MTDDDAMTKVRRALEPGVPSAGTEDRAAPPAGDPRPPQVVGLTEEELNAHGVQIKRHGLFDGLG